MPFWSKNKSFIGSLENASDKKLKKYQQTFQDFLSRGMAGRVFNGFDLAIPEDFQAFRKIYIKACNEKTSALSDKIRKKLNRWIKKIAKRACSELLDGYGYLNWKFTRLIECENLMEGYQRKQIQRILGSYVFTVIEEVCVKAVDVIKNSPEIYNQFCQELQKNFDRLTFKVIQKTQNPENRKLEQIMDAIYQDYYASLDFIDKFLSDKDDFLEMIVNKDDLNQAPVTILSKAYARWIRLESATNTTSRLFKFYLNRFLVIEAEMAKAQSQEVVPTTKIVTLQLTEALKEATTPPQIPVVSESKVSDPPVLVVEQKEEVDEDMLHIEFDEHCDLDGENPYELPHPWQANKSSSGKLAGFLFSAKQAIEIELPEIKKGSVAAP